jgi:hypothetical protein
LLGPGHDPGPHSWARSIACGYDDASSHVLARSPTLGTGGQEPKLTPVDRHRGNPHHSLVAGRSGIGHVDEINCQGTVASVDECLHERPGIPEIEVSDSPQPW